MSGRTGGIALFVLAATLQAAAAQNPQNPEPPGQPSVTVLGSKEVQSIVGSEIRSAADEDMGRIVDVLVDGSGQARAAIIDFGGFLGVGSRKIAIDWRLVRIKPGAKSPVRVRITKPDLEGAPEYDATAADNQMVGPILIERPEPPDAGN